LEQVYDLESVYATVPFDIVHDFLFDLFSRRRTVEPNICYDDDDDR